MAEDNLYDETEKKETLDEPNEAITKTDNEVASGEKSISSEEVDRRLREASEIGKKQTDEVEKRLEEAVEVGKKQNATPEAVAENLSKLQEETGKTRQLNASPIIIPRSSTRILSQQAPDTPIQTSSAPQQRRRRRAGFGVPGKGLAKGAGKKVIRRGAVWLFGTPTGWLVLGSIIATAAIIFMVFYILANICQLTNGLPFREVWAPAIHELCSDDPDPDSIPPPPPGFTINKKGPSRVGNNEPINYTIEVTYDPSKATYSLNDLTLRDTPDFAHEDPTGITQPSQYNGQSVSWNLSDFFDDSGIQQETFSLSVKPTITDDFVINFAYIDTPDVTGDILAGRDSAPSDNTCRGRYNVRSHPNFGDPVCSYTPARFSAYIRQVENKDRNWEFWEDISIAEGGSQNIGGNINSLGSGGSGTYQMSPANALHNHGDGRGWPDTPGASSGPHGDVTWQRQIEQAVGWNNYTNSRGDNFMHWGTAYCLCYFDSYRNSNKGWCDDIIRNRAVRCPQKCHPISSGASSCSVNTDRLAEKRGNDFQCNKYRCNIGVTGLDDNTDKPWN